MSLCILPVCILPVCILPVYILHNVTLHNVTLHYATLHNATLHNATNLMSFCIMSPIQHNSKKGGILDNKKIYHAQCHNSVIILSVIMISVVATVRGINQMYCVSRLQSTFPLKFGSNFFKFTAKVIYTRDFNCPIMQSFVTKIW
jgi:hypothetical protein